MKIHEYQGKKILKSYDIPIQDGVVIDNKEDIDGFTEFVRSIKGVEIAFMIQQVTDTAHRINFRSSGNYIINDVAKMFGGGGHIYAAGARIEDLSTKEIEQQILKQLIMKIENGN